MCHCFDGIRFSVFICAMEPSLRSSEANPIGIKMLIDGMVDSEALADTSPNDAVLLAKEFSLSFKRRLNCIQWLWFC